MVTLDKNGVKINGKYTTLLCASLFYFRLPKETWDERIDALIKAGYNCIDVYFPWNYHEIRDGEWTFEDMADADTFLKKAADAGLYIVARPGPYICSEWDGGALPARLLGGDYNIRQNNAKFLGEVKKWFDKIIPIIVKHETTGAGGVIMVQLENELDFFDCADPTGYLAKLAVMAKGLGVKVPLFACAGQKDIVRAGGTAKDVVGTYNFYPNSSDPTFDGLCAHYYDVAADLGIPLLVTETNRDHFLLRRQLACGAKLLGAYNQVAGSNFGFTMAVNNWGKPLSYISTKYDFGSLITSLGEYNSEVGAARELGLLIKAFGEELAAALPCDNFKNAGNYDRTLKLKSGGYLVCKPDFETKKAPFVPVDLPLEPYGLKGMVKSANTEILGFEPKTNTVIFKARERAKAEIIGGAKTRYITDGDITAMFGGVDYRPGHKTAQVPVIEIGEGKPGYRDIKAESSKPLNMEALGLYGGWVKYDTIGAFENGLFVENAADIVTTLIDGENQGTQIGTGSCLVYKGGKKASIKIEQWGHSNFDDARLANIRIASTRGATGVYAVTASFSPQLLDFKPLDEFLAPTVDVIKQPLCARLSVSLWNSTRMPLIAMYSFEAAMTGDKLYVKVTDAVENAVYVDGKLVGKGDYGYADVTAFVKKGKTALISVVYRKPHWAVDCGEVTVYDLKRLPVTVACMGEPEIVASVKAVDGKAANLPLKLQKGKEYFASLELKGDGCRYFRVKAEDVKLTFVLDGRVVGRIIGKFADAPVITGGSDTEFYIPGAWIKRNNRLRMYIESIGDKPLIESMEQIFKN